ncbi:MAG: helix-turn-helix domain-containing protein [Actinobacteria bacterium]|nr:helix-turn-helix domain-containing protein [Actinomycetota bacterium]
MNSRGGSGPHPSKLAGSKLREWRQRRGMSVSAVARAANVSKSTVSQLERHNGNPSLDTLWALASALNIPLGFLFDSDGVEESFHVVRHDERAALVFEQPNYEARLMAGWQMNGQIEIYLMTMTDGARRDSEPHGPGVIEHFLAMEGEIEVLAGHDSIRLEAGDMLTFSADRPHHYQAVGGSARGVSVQQYPAARPASAPMQGASAAPAATSSGAAGSGLRARLQAGEVVLGTMLFEFNTYGLPRILAEAGADFVVIDLEHTGWGVPEVLPLLATARAEPVAPIVRVQGSARHQVSTVLDAGAAGVMVPMVGDAEEAARVVEAARFGGPEGGRGFGLIYPDQIAVGVPTATAAADAETMVILFIETAEGLENVEAIAATPGVDVLWVGEYDLSISMGIPGAIDDPRLREAEERVVAACEAAGITAGILCGSVAAAQSRRERGFRMIAVGTDINLYARALGDELAEARSNGAGPA